MDFGFDIDGTLSAAPEALGEIARCLVAAGNGVHVITGGLSDHPFTGDEPHRDRVAQLEGLGLEEGKHYTALHLVMRPTVSEVAEGKRDLCAELAIVLMFEDTPLYTDSISQVTQCLLMV